MASFVQVPTGQQCSIDWNTGVINCAPQQTRPRIVTDTGNNNSNVSIQTNPNTGQIQISQNPDRIQQWIDAALSGLALFRNASYVPTTTQPNAVGNNSSGGYTQEQLLALYAAQNQNQNQNNFGGKLQSFIEQNTGVVLLLGAGLVLFLMKPPSKR